MLYTIGYRGFTIWRTSPAVPFRVTRGDWHDQATLSARAEPGTYRDFSSARREVDYLRLS